MAAWRWVVLLALVLLGVVAAAEWWTGAPPPAPPSQAPARPLAATPAPAPAPAPEDPGPQVPLQVHGRVVDALTGQGVAGARVTAGEGGASAVADATGAFALDGRGSRLRLRAVATGYEPREQDVATPGAAVVLTLARRTLLRVVVTRPGGGPAVGARVELVPPTPPRSHTTGQDGVVLVDGLDPGPYRVVARSGDGTSAASAEAAVAQGQHTTVALALVPSAWVAGQVQEADGAPAGGARLVVEAVDGTPLGSGTAAADGTFVLQGLAASDSARVLAAKGGRSGQSAVVALQRGRGAQGVTITLSKGGSVVAGTVVDEDNLPVSGATVELAPAWEGGDDTWATVVSDGEGKFEFADVQDGRFDLTARLGELDAVMDEVKAGTRNVVLQLLANAMVEGRAVDEALQPVARYRVRVEFARDLGPGGEGGKIRRGTEKTAAVDDPAGQFRVGPVKRGHYAVEVTTDDGRVGRAEGDVQGKRGVNVGDIKVGGAGTLRGRVVDRKSGAPVAGAQVRRMQRGAQPAVTGADGRFVMTVPAGHALLWVDHPAYFAKRVGPHTVMVGQDVDVGEVALIAGTRREIEGRQGFGGVGATLREANGQVVVDRLVDDGPGVRGGLKKGDVILSVDGEEVGSRGVQEAISNIRGEAGSTVWMKVKRGNEEITIPVRREPIHLDGR